MRTDNTVQTGFYCFLSAIGHFFHTKESNHPRTIVETIHDFVYMYICQVPRLIGQTSLRVFIRLNFYKLFDFHCILFSEVVSFNLVVTTTIDYEVNTNDMNVQVHLGYLINLHCFDILTNESYLTF